MLSLRIGSYDLNPDQIVAFGNDRVFTNCPSLPFIMLNADPEIMAITRKHRELCEGDAAVTLMRVEQAYKAGWRPIAVAELEPVTEEELVHWDANADLYDANMEFIEIIRRLIAEVRRLRRS